MANTRNRDPDDQGRHRSQGYRPEGLVTFAEYFEETFFPGSVCSQEKEVAHYKRRKYDGPKLLLSQFVGEGIEIDQAHNGERVEPLN